MFNTLLTEYSEYVCKITFNRPHNNNSINVEFLHELNAVFDSIEQDPKYKIIILQGQNGIFCTGLDFTESSIHTQQQSELFDLYMQMLKRISLIPKLVIAIIDGQVVAGGMGILAACDVVTATPNSTFSLSEALWGLLPACVIPYLIRRIGFQNAYRMALTTLPINAQKACQITLIDELNDSPEQYIKQLIIRISKIEQSTVKNIKQYFRKMWIITEEMESEAIGEIKRLLNLPDTQERLKDFIHDKRFPWEK